MTVRVPSANIQDARAICAECANGSHVCCLDDGSSTVACECPCSDDFNPDRQFVAARQWCVTLLDRGVEIEIRIAGRTKEHARRATKAAYPTSHIVHLLAADEVTL